MSTLRKAAQQALEALEQRDNATLWHQAIHALRAALEEPTRTQRMRDAGYTRRPTLREMAAQTPCDIAEDGVCEVIDCCRNPKQAEPVNKPDALRLADELDAVPENGADPDLVQEAATELRAMQAALDTLYVSASELRILKIQNAELTENLERKSVAIQRIWKERDELRRQRDALLEALSNLVDHIDLIPTDPYYRNETRKLVGSARAAIKAAEQTP